MIKDKASKGSRLKSYEVDAGYPRINSGIDVLPDTELGRGCGTGKIVRAGCYGRVLSVSFSPISNSFVIAIDKNDYLG